jgi:hypothetical protein
MEENGFPIHLIRKAESMYPNITIIISKDRVNGNTPIETNKEVLQGRPLLPMLFNIYTDKVTKYWQQVTKQNIL